MKVSRNIFKPRPKQHWLLSSEFKVMDLETMAIRRRELTRKNFPSEAWFMKLLQNNYINGYRRNMPIASRFFGDFVWRRAAIVVEIDGKSHKGKEDYDKRRDAFIVSLGIKIFRIEMGDISIAMKTITQLKLLGLQSKHNHLMIPKSH